MRPPLHCGRGQQQGARPCDAGRHGVADAERRPRCVQDNVGDVDALKVAFAVTFSQWDAVRHPFEVAVSVAVAVANGHSAGGSDADAVDGLVTLGDALSVVVGHGDAFGNDVAD